MRKILVLGLFSIGAASVVVAAQRGAVAPSMGHAMAPAPAVGAHAASPMHGAAPVAHDAPVHAGTHGVAPGMRPGTSHKPAGQSALPQPSSYSHSNSYQVQFSSFPSPFLGGTSNDPFADTYPTPGFGFDYAHFFAVHPNWGRSHPVDGVQLSWGGSGGFYMPVPYYTESTPQEEEEEQAASNQQLAPYQQAAAEEAPSAPRSRGGSYMSSEPVPEFVFMKHDGSTFSAVAYTWTKDKLQYVTKEGLRRTTGIDTLDLAATERINEERGNWVNLPKSLASSVALSIEPVPLR